MFLSIPSYSFSVCIFLKISNSQYMSNTKGIRSRLNSKSIMEDAYAVMQNVLNPIHLCMGKACTVRWFVSTRQLLIYGYHHYFLACFSWRPYFVDVWIVLCYFTVMLKVWFNVFTGKSTDIQEIFYRCLKSFDIKWQILSEKWGWTIKDVLSWIFF